LVLSLALNDLMKRDRRESQRASFAARHTEYANMNDTVTERIRELELRHRNLEVAVSRLGRRAYLTPGEQREIADLKKQKLLAKDQLFALRR
jgi:hypothetical protein